MPGSRLCECHVCVYNNQLQWHVCMCMHNIMIILYYRSTKLTVFIIQCNNSVILRTLESKILSF